MIRLKKGNGVLRSFFFFFPFFSFFFFFGRWVFFPMMLFSTASANGAQSPLHVANRRAGSNYVFIYM